MTVLKPFFTYFGGKWRAAAIYPAPAHDRIIEPFAGSAGYSLRYPDRDVWLNDADPIVAGTWAYLVRVTEREILALPDLTPDQTVDDLDLPQEARWLIGWWLNKGSAQPKRRPSTFMRDYPTHATSFWGRAVRERIAQQLPAIRHWTVTNDDYEELPTHAWNHPTTWFVDPPYQAAGTHYRWGSDRIDFPRLGRWCRALTGQVIVCENEGADWLPFQPYLAAKGTAGGRRSGVSREVIWLNGDHDATALFDDPVYTRGRT